jgi:orotate phosphoribosyltransferase
MISSQFTNNMETKTEKQKEDEKPSPVYSEFIGRKTADILIDTNSYIVDLDLKPENYFKWKSDILAPIYCNCRNLYEFGKESTRIGQYLAQIVEDEFPDVDTIVSIPMAGIGWGTRVANSLGLPSGYVRSEPKAHGIGTLVEGVPENARKTVVIDDLVASAGSIRKAIEHLHEERDIEVSGVLSITNWNFDKMYQNLKGITPSVKSLTSYPQILASAQKKGLISRIEKKSLEKFYENPSAFDFTKLQRRINGVQI